MTQQRIYFPGLNAIRAYAAIAVVIVHIYEAQTIPGLSSFDHTFDWLSYIIPGGFHAVSMFFVLSGFLITYLLLAEYHKTGTVDVPRFYARRALRIWPLYYLIIFLGFVLMPIISAPPGYSLPMEGYIFSFSDPDYATKLLLFVVMLPNVLFGSSGNVIPVAHLWSIGVEEQFYLMWAPLVKRFARKLVWLLYAVILFKVLSVLVLAFLAKSSAIELDTVNLIYLFLRNWRLESMAIGGFGAYLVFYDKRAILRVLYSRPVRWLTVVLLVLHIGWFDHRHIVFEMGMAVLYIIFILNVACAPKPLFRIENRVTTVLGNLSYGVYMYHFLILNLVLQWFRSVGLDDNANPLIYNLLLYVLVFGLTFAAASLSYYTFERFFLRLKDRFAIVRSGNSAAPAIAPPAPLNMAGSAD